MGILPQITKATDMNTEFIHVTAAEYISGYLLKLTFNNGDVRFFDFSSVHNKGIFTKLQNPLLSGFLWFDSMKVITSL